MSVIFNSIVVDPFVFYAVIVGVLLSMGIVIFLLMKNKSKKEDYINLEPIILNDTYDFESNVSTNILDVKKENDFKEKEEIVLDNILNKMEEDLNKKKEEPKLEYEEIEEQEAIISYSELLKKKNDEFIKEEKVDDLETLDINIQESKISEKTEEAVKKFKNSDFISPVFGKLDNNVEYPKIKAFKREDPITLMEEELNKDIDSKPLSKEFVKNEDFLNSLKDFRRNLE